MGENGAGKSTLGKILAGILRPESGEMRLHGRAVRFAGPAEARRAGVGMVHQELAACPDLTVAENLALGRYPCRLGVLLDRRAMHRAARDQLREIAPELDTDADVRSLPVAQLQLLQIAAAVGSGARLLIFDEPTSALSEVESSRLFALIRSLRERGVTILYVSHHMSEVFAISDRITVLRDGRDVGSVRTADTTQAELIGMMIGRSIAEYFPVHLRQEPGPEVLQVSHLSSAERFEDVSFSVRKGEILGIAGLVGSGRTELARALFGLDRAARGRIVLDDVEIGERTLRERMEAGVALVPEDRKRQGLALPLSCRMNFSLPILDRITRGGFLLKSIERRTMDALFSRLMVKTPSVDAPVAHLSGGNQQKIVLAKWLARQARLLILDEPTRGVDVGAKAALHQLIDELASQGLAIVLISSELPELLNLSTRILVMREGRIVGELPRASATQDQLLRMMSGLEPN
jgi:ABC-type sugar transport system ATPase subunit